MLWTACKAVDALWSKWYPPDVFGLAETEGQSELKQAWDYVKAAIAELEGE